MGRIFRRKQFTNYLGENRAILDTYVSWISGDTPTQTYFILFEDNDVMTTELNQGIEYVPQ
jgi:hypothetical protein